MRLDSFQAMLVNPSNPHENLDIKTAFDEFTEGVKHFFNTWKIENVCARKREEQFTHILDCIKFNLDTEKTGQNETQVLYTDKKNKIKIEQQGLTIVAVAIDQHGNTTSNLKELKTFSGLSDLQGFINGYPLISAAGGNHDFHKFLLSIRQEGLDNIKHKLNTEKIGPNDTHVLYTDKTQGIQIEQQGLKIVSVTLGTNKRQELQTFSDLSALQGFINGYPLISAAEGNHDFQKLLLSIRYEGQAFLPNVTKIAGAHFGNVPDEHLRLDTNKGEQRGECDVTKYTPTLVHLLRSQPELLTELRTNNVTATIEATDALEVAYPGVGGIGFAMLAIAMGAVKIADEENEQNLPLTTRQSPPAINVYHPIAD